MNPRRQRTSANEQETQQSAEQKLKALSEDEYQALVNQVAEHVWQMWREDLRHSRERRGTRKRS